METSNGNKRMLALNLTMNYFNNNHLMNQITKRIKSIIKQSLINHLRNSWCDERSVSWYFDTVGSISLALDGKVQTCGDHYTTLSKIKIELTV